MKQDLHKWVSYDQKKRKVQVVVEDEEILFDDVSLTVFEHIRGIVLDSEGVSQEELMQRVRNLK